MSNDGKWYRITIDLPPEDAEKLIKASGDAKPCDIVHALVIGFIQGYEDCEDLIEPEKSVAANSHPGLN